MPKKFSIEEAQKTLDERNGNFILLNYNGMRNKADVVCKKCGHISNVIPDNLLRHKTDINFGCKNCNRSQVLLKLKNNSLEYISTNGYITKVKCKICGKIFEKRTSLLISEKFLCPYCNEDIKNKKILEHKELYKQNTIKCAERNHYIKKVIDLDSNYLYYCLGLFMSDGHFNKNSKRLQLYLNIRDFEVIKNISNFLSCDIILKGNNCGIDIVCESILELINKYKISDRKTYKPCDISSITGDKFIYFLIGFIDGDGCIGFRSDSNTPRIVIKLHNSWKDNLEYMSNSLYSYFGLLSAPKANVICNNKYATITWGNQKILFGLKNFIISNNIKVMNRKWNKIKEMV